MKLMKEEESDAALVAAWGRGDSRAARRVVELHGPAILRVALALCPNADDAEDVVQDALLLAYRSLRRFEPRKGSLRSWLLAVTANRARQARRARTRYGRFLARMRREPYLPTKSSAARGDFAFARRRLAQLPAREREAFVLMEIEELTSIEAARIMKVSDSTVRVLLSRARAHLQEEPSDPKPRSLRAEGREP
jgi:RNA polymerase sigma-70 factor (ECF subfamily)